MLSIFRILKFAIQGFFRNFWLSIVTITMMIMAVLSMTLLVGINHIKDTTVQGVEQKVDISVSMKQDVAREDVESLVHDLEGIEEVKSIVIITPEENLEIFRQNNADSPIKDALDIFADDENPLSYSVVIQAFELNQYEGILDFLDQDQYLALTESSTFRDHKDIVAKIDSLANIVNKYSWYVIVVFILISIIVIFNTVRMSIYTRKNEVMIMKLVGATNWFVRTPFLLESIFYGLVAILIVMAVIYPLLDFVIQPSINNYFSGLELSAYFKNNIFYIFGYQFLILSIINVLSTAVAIKRYLKV